MGRAFRLRRTGLNGSAYHHRNHKQINIRGVDGLVNSTSKRFPKIHFVLKFRHSHTCIPGGVLQMGSDRKGFSRRHFLSTAVTSTVVSLLARPAFSSALSSLASAPAGTAPLDAAATS